MLAAGWAFEPELHSNFPIHFFVWDEADKKENLLRNCCEIAICSQYTRAEPTGLEPATSAVTGQRSNQLS